MYLFLFLLCVIFVIGSFYNFLLSLLGISSKLFAVPLLFFSVLLLMLCFNYRSRFRKTKEL